MNDRDNKYYEIETVIQPIGSLHLGTNSTVPINLMSKLITRMYLQINLPKLVATKGNVAWIKVLGFSIIKNLKFRAYIYQKGKCDFEVSGYVDTGHIDTHKFNKMFGNVEELTSFDSEKNAYTIFVPLHFWLKDQEISIFPFNTRNYDKLEISFELRDFKNLIVKSPDAEVIELSSVECSVLTSFVDLDIDEYDEVTTFYSTFGDKI